MKKLKCFLCGTKYNPAQREAVASILARSNEGEGEVVNMKYLQWNHKTLQLCPACMTAAILGYVMADVSNPHGLRWFGDIQLEDEEA